MSVPKDFAENLREQYDGTNDWQRLHDWAEKTYYKNSITNEDIVAKIQELNEKLDDFEQKPDQSYNDSITVEDIESVIQRMTIDRRTGEVILE